MGLDYSLCALVDRQKSAPWLPRFVELLDDRSRARFKNLVWTPASETQRTTYIGTTETDARGIAGFELDEHDRDNNYCLSFLVQFEPEMRKHLTDWRECFDAPGPFGCMWTSVLAGARYVLIESTAATSGMSRALRDSSVMHGMWRQFAEDIQAVTAYVDIEDESGMQLYPGTEDLIMPDVNTLAFEDDYHFSIDLMAEYLCRMNRLDRPSS